MLRLSSMLSAEVKVFAEILQEAAFQQQTEVHDEV
jgi:hypothetical protein